MVALLEFADTYVYTHPMKITHIPYMYTSSRGVAKKVIAVVYKVTRFRDSRRDAQTHRFIQQ